TKIPLPAIGPGTSGFESGDWQDVRAGTSPATGLCPGCWRGLARRAFGPPDLAGDRPGIADCLDKMHAVTDLQLVEIALHQTVAVEIELRPFMRQDKAVIFVRVKL